MVTLTHVNNKKIKTSKELNEVFDTPMEDVLWIDILKETAPDLSKLEDYLKVQLLNLSSIKNIEHSSRFIENENELTINTNVLFLDDNTFESSPVSFILKDVFLISYHNISHLSYDELHNKIKKIKISKLDGKIIFLKFFENIIDFDIDLIENITKDIAELGKKLKDSENQSEELIYLITHFQELLMILRINILDKQRVISSISKSEYFSKNRYKKHISIIEKDINSLLDYTAYDVERLEYLQDTLMGLINSRQNVIMKIFTIVSVVFLPPTLIASIYGMNFSDMPELTFPYAYPLAITSMVILSLIALFIFKLKKWI